MRSVLVIPAVLLFVTLSACTSTDPDELRFNPASSTSVGTDSDPGTTAAQPLTTAAPGQMREEECDALRGITEPLRPVMTVDEGPVSPPDAAGATAAAEALRVVSWTSSTGDLLSGYLADGLVLAAQNGEVPTSLVDDYERLDRFCPAG